MELKQLKLDTDKSNSIFASDECQQLMDIYADYYPKMGYNPPWIAYWITNNNVVMGTASFTGKPTENTVEIAYWIFDKHQGKGVASFACNELVKIAQHTDPEVKITAKTAPEKNASTRILEKNGFVFSTVVQDEEIGDAWLWIWKG